MSDAISPTGMGGSDETRKAVSGWKAMRSGERESRRERIARERREGINQDPDDVAGVSSEARRKAIQEAVQYKEQELENPMGHLRKAYQQKRKRDANIRNVKLDSDKTLLLLCEITEKNGEILEVEQAGFGVYKVKYIL